MLTRNRKRGTSTRERMYEGSRTAEDPSDLISVTNTMETTGSEEKDKGMILRSRSKGRLPSLADMCRGEPESRGTKRKIGDTQYSQGSAPSPKRATPTTVATNTTAGTRATEPLNDDFEAEEEAAAASLLGLASFAVQLTATTNPSPSFGTPREEIPLQESKAENAYSIQIPPRSGNGAPGNGSGKYPPASPSSSEYYPPRGLSKPENSYANVQANRPQQNLHVTQNSFQADNGVPGSTPLPPKNHGLLSHINKSLTNDPSSASVNFPLKRMPEDSQMRVEVPEGGYPKQVTYSNVPSVKSVYNSGSDLDNQVADVPPPYFAEGDGNSINPVLIFNSKRTSQQLTGPNATIQRQNFLATHSDPTQEARMLKEKSEQGRQGFAPPYSDPEAPLGPPATASQSVSTQHGPQQGAPVHPQQQNLSPSPSQQQQHQAASQQVPQGHPHASHSSQQGHPPQLQPTQHVQHVTLPPQPPAQTQAHPQPQGQATHQHQPQASPSRQPPQQAPPLSLHEVESGTGRQEPSPPEGVESRQDIPSRFETEPREQAPKTLGGIDSLLNSLNDGLYPRIRNHPVLDSRTNKTFINPNLHTGHEFKNTIVNTSPSPSMRSSHLSPSRQGPLSSYQPSSPRPPNNHHAVQSYTHYTPSHLTSHHQPQSSTNSHPNFSSSHAPSLLPSYSSSTGSNPGRTLPPLKQFPPKSQVQLPPPSHQHRQQIEEGGEEIVQQAEQKSVPTNLLPKTTLTFMPTQQTPSQQSQHPSSRIPRLQSFERTSEVLQEQTTSHLAPEEGQSTTDLILPSTKMMVESVHNERMETEEVHSGFSTTTRPN